MKKIAAIIICLLLSSTAFSQDNEGFFQRLKNRFVSHDTVYIYIHGNDTIINIEDDEEEDEEEDEEFSEGTTILNYQFVCPFCSQSAPELTVCQTQVSTTFSLVGLWFEGPGARPLHTDSMSK